jgi:hypothetical protein
MFIIQILHDMQGQYSRLPMLSLSSVHCFVFTKFTGRVNRPLVREDKLLYCTSDTILKSTLAD